ncbi:hypothetical protein B566_EDAN007707 [Ephemera danica]|nr:hypothetical protein B566_EDAN007707 [Ephemera danica]
MKAMKLCFIIHLFLLLCLDLIEAQKDDVNKPRKELEIALLKSRRLAQKLVELHSALKDVKKLMDKKYELTEKKSVKIILLTDYAVTKMNSLEISEKNKNFITTSRIEERKTIPDYSIGIRKFWSSFQGNACPKFLKLYCPKSTKTGNYSNGLIPGGGLAFQCEKKNYIMHRGMTLGTCGEAWRFCCSLGMTPVTLESKQELDCLIQTFKNNSAQWRGPNEKLFWTSYIDIPMNHSYPSCTKRSTPPPSLWAPMKPDNLRGYEEGVALRLWPQESAGLVDKQTTNSFMYLCDTTPLKQ